MFPFSDGSFAVRNGWYVAAFAHEVSTSPIARTFLGEPVALYRKSSGEAVAVGGRCPHRGYPLGKSFVENDQLVCGYHGIAFDSDGKCSRVPSQAMIPGAICIPTYPLVEHGEWLWIWMGEKDKADPALLPDLKEIGLVDEGMNAFPLFFFEVNCRYQLLNDNLLDLTHLAFLHSTSIGTIDNATTPEQLSREDRVLRSRRYIRGGQPSPSIRTRFGHDGLVDEVVGMDFYLPGFHAGIGDHYYSSDTPDRQGELIQKGRVFHAITPSTPTSSYYWFALASPNPNAGEEARAALPSVLAEDVFASEEIEKMIQLSGGSISELMIKSDKTTVLGRRMLQDMMDQEASG